MLIDKNKEKTESTAVFYRRIGSTTYKVCIHFSDTTEETINDKILHLIQREIPAGGYDMKDVPQTGQPPERGSL